MLCLRQGWGQGNPSPDFSPKTSFERPLQSMATASVTCILACSLPATATGPQWPVSSHGQDRPCLPYFICPSSPGTETADQSVSSSRRPLWHLNTRHTTPSPLLAETTWVKDQEKSCLTRSIKPFCTYSLPLFLVSKPCFIFFISYGTWINTEILNVPRGILHLNQDSLPRGIRLPLHLHVPRTHFLWRILVSSDPVMCPEFCYKHFNM